VAVYFVDSSALVKRYVQEVGTPWVRRLTHRGQAHEIYLASITPVGTRNRDGLETGTQLESITSCDPVSALMVWMV
jgi:polyferredoxin